MPTTAFRQVLCLPHLNFSSYPITRIHSGTRQLKIRAETFADNEQQRVQVPIPTLPIPTNASEKAQLTLTLTLTVTLTLTLPLTLSATLSVEWDVKL